jgi:hypothetical protein
MKPIIIETNKNSKSTAFVTKLSEEEKKSQEEYQCVPLPSDDFVKDGK